MNKVVLLGRLTKDPETRVSTGGLTVTKYTLAVNRRGKQGEADFINCVAFGKAAEFADKYFSKGQQVAVVGRIQTRSWADETGAKHYATEVVAEEQYFADSKKDSPRAGGAYGQNIAPAAPANESWSQQSLGGQAYYPIDEGDDDLPF